MEQFKINPNCNSQLPICFKKAKFIQRGTLRQIKSIPVDLLQSNKVIVDMPSKPTSRIFSVERIELELNEAL